MDLETARNIASLFTPVAVALAAGSLFKEYRWRRKQMCLTMLAEWNKHTADHRERIHAAFPGLLSGQGNLNFKTHAAEILAGTFTDATSSDTDSSANSDATLNPPLDAALLRDPRLRRSIIELLNYCEYISVAYLNEIADIRLMEKSMMSAIDEWYEALKPFVVKRTEVRGRNPWQQIEVALAARQVRQRSVKRS